jgi:anaerobic selenocysteine-containing dehydrogenase
VPGTEAALLLALARVILDERRYDRAFIERWVNWQEGFRLVEVASPLMSGAGGPAPGARPDATSRSGAGFASVHDFLAALQQLYAEFTPQFAERECGVPAETIVEIGRLIGEAGSKFCSHTWRGAASAHLGGWQVSRCLFLLHVLTGSVGTEGGCSPAGWHKYKASLINVPPPQNHWNELHWPREYPLAHYEMSFLLPHFLKEGRGKIDVYFTRVFNPVWTYPDGFTWIEALRDESKVGLHVALTPTWNETAFFADYVLPMGHGPERHDLNTYETHSGTWIAFRQPVLRAVAQAEGQAIVDTRDVNPGKVWEEDEFWIALCWAIDPDGSLGIRRFFESEQRPGTKLTVDEYYAYAFERVPGLPEHAKAVGLAPLDYMRKYGAFEIKPREYRRHERPLSAQELEGTEIDREGRVVTKSGAALGIQLDGVAVEGFPTPSRRLEFSSATMTEWGWPEYAVPGYIRSHLYEGSRGEGIEGSRVQESADVADGLSEHSEISNPQSARSSPAAAGNSPSTMQSEFCLLPTFRLPTLIHTRSGAAKWLNEISQRNPVWIHTSDARRLGVVTGDLVRLSTAIGYFVDKVWVTEAIRPGVVACSHHLGRWRRPNDPPNARWSGSVVQVEEIGPGQWRMRPISGPQPFDSTDADSRRIWWRDGGVPQNLTFPVQPDPISGMHCWHQRVRVERAAEGDASGDVFVDTAKSMEVYRQWLEKTRWPVGPGDFRRPLWLGRPLRPVDAAFRL